VQIGGAPKVEKGKKKKKKKKPKKAGVTHCAPPPPPTISSPTIPSRTEPSKKAVRTMASLMIENVELFEAGQGPTPTGGFRPSPPEKSVSASKISRARIMEFQFF
jgi:hypothetical protein